MPTALIRKAELGLLEKVSKCSNSSLEIIPFSYIEAAVFAPIGNPQIRPKKNAQLPAPDTPNRNFDGAEINLPSSSPIPLDIKSSDMTINGKSDGIIVFAHTYSPAPIYSMATSLLPRIRKKDRMAIAPKQRLPGENFLFFAVFFIFIFTLYVLRFCILN